MVFRRQDLQLAGRLNQLGPAGWYAGDVWSWYRPGVQSVSNLRCNGTVSSRPHRTGRKDMKRYR
jgi:hypothetical protein